jgi:hypothetical protein
VLDEKARKDSPETTELTAKLGRPVCKEKLAAMGYQGGTTRCPSFLHNLHISTNKQIFQLLYFSNCFNF